MYKYIILLVVTTIGYAIAESDKSATVTDSYKSYSYSLMDEMRLGAKQENNYGRVITKKKSKTSIQATQDQNNIEAKDLNHFFAYEDDFRNILDINNSSENSFNNQYTIGNFSAKLNYSSIKTRQNKVNAATLHVDYELAPGVLPYFETTHFRGGTSVDYNDKMKNKKRSTLFLIGTKIEF